MSRSLDALFPQPKTPLHYKKPWDLLVSVILSAQTQDKKVNEVTKTLFKKYRTVGEYARAKPYTLAQDIFPISFYRTKARNIIKTATIIKKKHNGKIPQTLEELVSLPGVGRKTANVVLGNLHGESVGIAVDTHVRRLARKFNLTDNTAPVKIEQDLMDLLPQSRWFSFGQNLVLYGQQICSARKHDCTNHPLTKIYPDSATIWPKSQ